AGHGYQIEWTAFSSDPAATAGMDIAIDYKCDGGSWTNIVPDTENDSIFSWNVPDIVSDHCFFRVSATDSHGLFASGQSEEFKIKKGVSAGDVVINEVMWMGSQRNTGSVYSADEWIELKNTTGHEIDIKNWDIYGIAKGGHYEISGGSSVMIPAGGYFLIADKDDDDPNSLTNVSPDRTTNNIDIENNYSENGKIILKNNTGVTIDETPSIPTDGHWPAGMNENHARFSMERNSRGQDWHTCNPADMSTDELSQMHSYWDSDAQNYNCGTPGHKNLSKNDPTEEEIMGLQFNKEKGNNNVSGSQSADELKNNIVTENENITVGETAPEGEVKIETENNDGDTNNNEEGEMKKEDSPVTEKTVELNLTKTAVQTEQPKEEDSKKEESKTEVVKEEI
ncbi:MAG TPA: lamin tail domain-containing protein, partial [Patescibacteria group bacterium]|nr:lamin tail domain-containing protein [Patescibacteria group bacterium]